RGTFRILDITTNRVIQRANIHRHSTKDDRVRFPTSDFDRDNEGLDDNPGYILPPHARRRATDNLDDTPGYILPPHARKQTGEIQKMGSECDNNGITWIEGGLSDGELVEVIVESIFDDENEGDDNGMDQTQDNQCERELQRLSIGNGEDNILPHHTRSGNTSTKAAVFIVQFFMTCLSVSIQTTLVMCASDNYIRVLASKLPPEPKTVRAARSSPECDLWDRARAEEMSGLLLVKVWVEAVLPPGRRAIDTKWIHKRKINK
ncbi:unnamed protein product, partial [Choristocarpus tenellus]